MDETDRPPELLDLFAAFALAGLLARGERRVRTPEAQDRLSEEALEQAESMLRVRARRRD